MVKIYGKKYEKRVELQSPAQKAWTHMCVCVHASVCVSECVCVGGERGHTVQLCFWPNVRIFLQLLVQSCTGDGSGIWLPPWPEGHGDIGTVE